MWLYKYLPKYQSIYNLNQNIVPYHCFKNSNWSNSCNFDELFDRFCPFYLPDPMESLTTLKPFYITHTPSTVSFSMFQTTLSRNSSTNGAEFKIATFYLAIFLSIICVVIISVLIIIYYQVFNQSKRLECLIETQNTDVTMHI
jgi:hypothetical protein